MSFFATLRVFGALARISAPSMVDLWSVRRSDEVRAVPPELRKKIDDRAKWFGTRVVSLLGIDLVTTGAELVPPGRSYIYMSNHQSQLDIPVLFATLPSPTIRMLAKKELFQIPVWGRALRAAEFVEVDRSDHLRGMESINRAAQLLRDGVSIYLAPEGTRSRDGRLGALKKGGFHLSRNTGTPIVPVAIRGTIDILPRGSLRMRCGMRVEVTIGRPIDPTQHSLSGSAAHPGAARIIDPTGRDIPELMAEVEAFLRSHVEK